MGRVLAARGIELAQAPSYLNPTLRVMLPDPSRLKDMDRAAARLATAIMREEPVTVFGDYDVDGATSTAVLRRFWNEVGGQLGLYIPDRLTEGYGPNEPALRRIAADGTRLVVTVDCGSVAFEPLEAAAGAGLEVIVVDHHLAPPSLPPAYAVINPNRADEDGSLSQLAAVGVSFLLVVAVNRALRDAGWYSQREEPELLQWLDLVALGTVCDVVPLTGVNRALTRKGLEVMAGRHNIGLSALADVAGLAERPDASHLGFVLGPRVNAGGRVGRADLGARLLATTDPDEAREIAAELDRLNAERRAIEAIVLEEAMEQANRRHRDGAGPLVLVAEEGWHPGVIGIVASRLKDHFGRPAMVIAIDENGMGRGSGRSITGVDLGAAVTAAREAGLLINGGGHRMAAGLTVFQGRINVLREFLAASISPQLGDLEAPRPLDIDAAMAPGGLSDDLVTALAQAGPYGAGNPEPRFAIAGLTVSHADIVGNGHVRCTLVGNDGARVRAIAFGAATRPVGEVLLSSGVVPLHVAGTVRADRRFGASHVQVVIDDIAPACGAS